MFLEVLLEGTADVPAVKHILERRFRLEENTHFRLHPHRGKGRLPANPRARPDPRHRGLLDQLPAKLRGYAHLPDDYWLVVLVDADKDDCVVLKNALVDLYRNMPRRPPNVLFRVAVEETESWFLADPEALCAAYPKLKRTRFPDLEPDEVHGAWECLARILGRRPETCSGSDKRTWAEAITPHLDLKQPRSPSLRAFIDGITRCCLAPS